MYRPLFQTVRSLFFFSLALLFVTGCSTGYIARSSNALSSIDIVDSNGMTQTISSPERLRTYQGVDFLSCQPYEKVMRVFERDQSNAIRSIITSYHPNGQPKQMLEIVNGRARGAYREWFANGSLHIEATVVGGIADITPEAEASWLFDGANRAWDENGVLTAEIQYQSGQLHGPALYYHPNGAIWKSLDHNKGKRQGTAETFTSNGTLLLSQEFRDGLLHGESRRYWTQKECQLSTRETFRENRLITGCYWDLDGTPVGGIEKGHGTRITFGKEGIAQKLEVVKGEPQGLVENYSAEGYLVHSYITSDGERHGKEVYYYTPSGLPKTEVPWCHGVIQGTIKTWYPDGNLESQREMSDNKKQGITTVWYRDGNLMLLEEYKEEQLVKGEYHRRAEYLPVSKVQNGTGICTLFDGEGNFLRRIHYEQGDPV